MSNSYKEQLASKTTARDARTILLNRAPEVIETLINTAIGFDQDGALTNEPNLEALLEITKKMLPIIKLEDDRIDKTIECGMETNQKEITANQLIQMQLKGQLSETELENAMNILKDKFEIDELGDVLSQLQQLSQ